MYFQLPLFPARIGKQPVISWGVSASANDACGRISEHCAVGKPIVRGRTCNVPCGRDRLTGKVNPDCEASFAVLRRDYHLKPQPYRSLLCVQCLHVLHLVSEPSRPILALWAIDQGQDESFRDFVDRTSEGWGGPLGGDLV